jgi:hypothetical protein
VFGHWVRERRERRYLRALVRDANGAVARVGEIIQTPDAAFFDEKLLPADKESMKWAFKFALAAERNPVYANLLFVRWMRLADFQPGIGDVPLSYPPLHDNITPETPVAMGRYMLMQSRAAQERIKLGGEIREFINANARR